MDPALVAVVAAAIGSILTKAVEKYFAKPKTATDIQGEFYIMWEKELVRLRVEINHLHALVAALETELITLGGDPYKIRMEAAKRLREAEQELEGDK